jgi:hypothetical protein
MNLPELLEFSECSCWWGDTGGSGEWALELLEDVRTELEVRKDLELGDAGAVVRAQHCLEETLDWAQASERTAVWAALAEEARTRVGVAALTEALEAFLEEEIPGEEVDTTPVWLGVRSWPRVYDEVEVLRKVLGVDHGSRAVVELPMWAALELVGIARENGYARCDVASPGRADALEATRVLWADGAQTLAGAREVAEAL